MYRLHSSASMWLLVLFSLCNGDPCVWTDGGKKFDMSDFHMDKDAVSSVQGISYSMNLCGVVLDMDDCATDDGSVCQYDDDGLIATIARWNREPGPTWGWIDEKKKSEGFTIDFDNGDDCWLSGQTINRMAKIKLKCKKGAAGDTFTLTENPQCTFNIEHESEMACKVVDDNNVTDGALLSIGSIILICFGGVLLLYLVIGLIFNIKKGKRGTEAIPQSDFWRELPFYVKDGCSFCFKKLPCRKKTTEYDEII